MKSTVREHLTAFHEHAAEHHTQKAVQCGVMAKCHETMAKAADENDDEVTRDSHAKIAEMHQQASDSHTEMAKFHLKAAKDCAAESKKADEPVTSKTEGLGELSRFVAPSGDALGDESPVVPGFESLYR